MTDVPLVALDAPGGGVPVQLLVPAAPNPIAFGPPAAIPGIAVALAGAIGPQGIQGPVGITTGFGQVTYTRALSEPGEAMAENVPTRLVFATDPALTQIYLNPPFADHVFWDGTAIRARAFADRISVQVNLRLRAQRAGGTLLLECEAGSPTGPIVADGKTLFKAAGVVERVTLDLAFQTNAYVIANGGALILTSSVPVTLLRKTVLVAPESLYVGTGP